MLVCQSRLSTDCSGRSASPEDPSTIYSRSQCGGQGLRHGGFCLTDDPHTARGTVLKTCELHLLSASSALTGIFDNQPQAHERCSTAGPSSCSRQRLQLIVCLSISMTVSGALSLLTF